MNFNIERMREISRSVYLIQSSIVILRWYSYYCHAKTLAFMSVKYISHRKGKTYIEGV
jgi:hypothetical protein